MSKDAFYQVNEAVTSGGSPFTVSLRTSDDTVPTDVSSYKVAQAVFAEVGSAAGEVAVQNYDPDGAAVEEEVVYTLGSDGTVQAGESSDKPILKVDRGNELRIATDTDVDVTLYLDPDDA